LANAIAFFDDAQVAAGQYGYDEATTEAPSWSFGTGGQDYCRRVANALRGGV